MAGPAHIAGLFGIHKVFVWFTDVYAMLYMRLCLLFGGYILVYVKHACILQPGYTDRVVFCGSGDGSYV